MFWKEVKKSRKLNAKRAPVVSTKPSADDFVKFYRTLFSHDDRPSNASHDKIASEVKDFAKSTESENCSLSFSKEMIDEALDFLKPGKAAGYGGFSNEFFVMGRSCVLTDLFYSMFNLMLSSGLVPDKFNTSVLIPIPKGNKLSMPSDYRPISISTPLCTLFELLIRKSMPFLEYLHPNQFGYKKETSCKSAYFVVNETLNHYKDSNSNCHAVSLDAAKAFDKLWRDGLFFKLIPWTEPGIWRLLYRYYNESFVMVILDDFKSDVFKISEGVKQGGILSSFLFNFFMDGLLEKLLKLKVGTILGKINTSVIAYRDDIILLAALSSHMQLLLDNCLEYANDWKLSFNPSKSHSFSLKPGGCALSLDGSLFPKSDGFVYLGLPVGNMNFVEKFYSNRMSKCERALYSLKSIGCSPQKLHPYAIAFIFKQFCQSIFKFGLEFVYLRKTFLNSLNIRQNLLLKNILGIRHKARFKPLLNELCVEQINLVYAKHKIFGWKQCMKNQMTSSIYSFLLSCKSQVKNNFSFTKQLADVVGDKILTARSVCSIVVDVESEYVCNDVTMREQIISTLKEFHSAGPFACIVKLNSILKILY